jgi:hypothetical protein
MSDLEKRSRALFEDSVDGLDFATRSRLTRARHSAVEAAAGATSRSRLFGMPLWKPAASVAAAAAALGVALWFGPLSGTLFGTHAVASAAPTNLEDLDIVASSDASAGDAIEMLQDDIDFYDFADKAANTGPAA